MNDQIQRRIGYFQVLLHFVDKLKSPNLVLLQFLQLLGHREFPVLIIQLLHYKNLRMLPEVLYLLQRDQ